MKKLLLVTMISAVMLAVYGGAQEQQQEPQKDAPRKAMRAHRREMMGCELRNMGNREYDVHPMRGHCGGPDPDVCRLSAKEIWREEKDPNHYTTEDPITVAMGYQSILITHTKDFKVDVEPVKGQGDACSAAPPFYFGNTGHSHNFRFSTGSPKPDDSLYGCQYHIYVTEKSDDAKPKSGDPHIIITR